MSIAEIPPDLRPTSRRPWPAAQVVTTATGCAGRFVRMVLLGTDRAGWAVGVRPGRAPVARCGTRQPCSA
jgi:hypothetical protein